MERIDQTYLTDLVNRVKRGDSNAFAELFAAFCEQPYAYLRYMLGEEEAAKEMLQEAMTHVLWGLQTLQNSGLYTAWLARICFRVCEERSASNTPEDEETPRSLAQHAPAGDSTPRNRRIPAAETVISTPAGPCRTSRILSLPLTEAQVLLMHCGQGMSEGQIGDILNMSRRQVRREIRSGCRHLERDRAELGAVREGRDADPGAGGMAPEVNAAAGARSKSAERSRISPLSAFRKDSADAELDGLTASRMLEQIYDAAGWEPNTVPLEALASYTVYRKERFSLQRGILIFFLVLFFLMPVLFVLPGYRVSVEEQGLRGLPVYTIRVTSLLPINRVTAKLKRHALPVYEAGAREFTVEPTRNGTMTVEVELVNRQRLAEELDVTAVDAEGPKLTGSDTTEETVLLQLSDAGIGVDFHEIYAVGASGEVFAPLSVDAEKGEVTFSYPQEDWDVYIPDHIGNTLHLSLTLD